MVIIVSFLTFTRKLQFLILAGLSVWDGRGCSFYFGPYIEVHTYIHSGFLHSVLMPLRTSWRYLVVSHSFRQSTLSHVYFVR